MRARPHAIVDLRQRPEFAAQVSERVWRAWWKDAGHTLDHVEGLVRDSLGSANVPACFVACEGARFIGTSSLVESDCSTRPDLSPWVAAVWVDAADRGRGVGRALVRHAAEAAFQLERRPVYLCARPEVGGFYRGLGWAEIERNVGAAGLTVFSTE